MFMVLLSLLIQPNSVDLFEGSWVYLNHADRLGDLLLALIVNISSSSGIQFIQMGVRLNYLKMISSSRRYVCQRGRHKLIQL